MGEERALGFGGAVDFFGLRPERLEGRAGELLFLFAPRQKSGEAENKAKTATENAKRDEQGES